MSTMLQTDTSGETVDPALRGLPDYFGSSMKPGAKLDLLIYVWPSWLKVGTVACVALSKDSIQVKIDAEVKPLPPVHDLPVSVQLLAMGRCLITIGSRTDPNGRYYLERGSILVESDNFDSFKPSARVWPEGKETKGDAWFTLGVRHKVHFAVAPPKSAAIEAYNEAMRAMSNP